jgi:hypothetical protein
MNPTPHNNPLWIEELLTREQVIASIEEKSNTFYVIDPRTGKRAEVGVVKPTGRDPYVRTYADGNWNDNLLSLNQCPI